MLTLSLKGLVERKGKPLSPDLNLLYQDLVSTYGEPVYKFGDLKSSSAKEMGSADALTHFP